MARSGPDYNITIGFSTTKLRISGLIRWITGSSCSHTFIAFDDQSLKMRMVMQAESWGYELRPWNRWQRSNILVAEFKPVGPKLDDALCKLARRLGTKFDYRSFLIIGIKSIFTSWYKNRFSLSPSRDPWKLTCSEAVVRFLKYGHYATASGLDPETTGPGELLREIIQNRKEFRAVYVNNHYLMFDREVRRAPSRYAVGEKKRRDDEIENRRR